MTEDQRRHLVSAITDLQCAAGSVEQLRREAAAEAEADDLLASVGLPSVADLLGDVLQAIDQAAEILEDLR